MNYEEKTKEELIEEINLLDSKNTDLEIKYDEAIQEKDKWMTRANEYSDTIDDRDDEICNLEDEIEKLEDNNSLEGKINEVYLNSIGSNNTKILLECRKGVNIYLYVE